MYYRTSGYELAMSMIVTLKIINRLTCVRTDHAGSQRSKLSLRVIAKSALTSDQIDVR